jgi:hypothetical protein
MKPSILHLAYGKGAASQFEDAEAQVATVSRAKACSPRDRAKP